MTTQKPKSEGEPENIDRQELERDLVEWFKTQNYSPDEMDQVLTKLREFDDRTLQESFFASVGTGSIEFTEIISSILSEHSDKPAELEFIIHQWPNLSPATRKAIYVLAEGTLPASTHQAVIALIDVLPPTA
jgi:hypothetical protein